MGHFILSSQLDLSGEIIDTHPNLLRWDQLAQPLLKDVAEVIEYAATDPKVQGIVAHVGGISANNGIATIQEIRDQIALFSSARIPDTSEKKFSIAIADSFGLLGGGLLPYYLSSAFSQIVVQPTGYVAISGLSAQPVFIRGLLDKLGVVPRIFKREEYKNAANMFTETGLTSHHREAVQSYLDNLNSQIVSGIADSRHLSEKDVQSLIKSAPHDASDSKRLGLVDILGYPYLMHMINEKACHKDLRNGFFPNFPNNPRIIRFDEYLRHMKIMKRKFVTKSKVALIYATGMIMDQSPEMSGNLSAMQITKEIVKATADPQVKAIVVRVNSPGGSALASDMIYEALWQAREKGKPVVASMGDLAASGGYYVAMAANKIVAQPGTITGSIGVLLGKFVMNQFFNKLGINIDGIYPDRGSRWMSVVEDLNEEDQKQINGLMDAQYASFLQKASISRNLPMEHITKYAQGRVWTGIQAKDAKLIDEFGGLDHAIKIATQMARERDEQIKSLDVVMFPERENILQKLSRMLQNSGRFPEGVGESARAIRLFSSTMNQINQVLSPFFKGMNAPHLEMRFRKDNDDE